MCRAVGRCEREFVMGWRGRKGKGDGEKAFWLDVDKDKMQSLTCNVDEAVLRSLEGEIYRVMDVHISSYYKVRKEQATGIGLEVEKEECCWNI